ncbi:MAG: hypothetical protein ACOCTG_02295 [Bacteroidota bacterium]
MNTTRIALYAVVILLLTAHAAAGQFWQWSRGAGGPGLDEAWAIAANSDGAYITGYFENTAHFDDISLSSVGSLDVFVARYSPEGDIVWVKQGGSPDRDSGTAIGVDASGSIYVGGVFSNSIDFGETSLTSAGRFDLFVVKYDREGEVLWALRGGGKDRDGCTALAVSPDADVYIGGYFQGTATLGSQTLASPDVQSGFVAKLSPNGVVEWVRIIRASVHVGSQAIAIDDDGNVYVAGHFEGTGEWDMTTQMTSEGTDGFIAKYAADGDVLWIRSVGGPGHDRIDGIAFDGNGSLYVAGTFAETATFGDGTLTSLGEDDGFMAKYDTDGALTWVRQIGGADWIAAADVSVDPSDQAVVAGHFQGIATLQGVALESAGDYDVFVATYDSSGDVLWAEHAGGSDFDQVGRISIDDEGGIYISGAYSSSATFGAETLTAAGYYDVYIAKLAGNDVFAEPSPKPVRGGITLSSVWPSPASSSAEAVVTASEGVHTVQVDVIDVLGRRAAAIFSGPLPPNTPMSMRVDTAQLSPGLYFLRARSELGMSAVRFIVVGY